MVASDVERIRGGEGSKFNSSLSDLERIHNIIMLCNQASTIRNYPLWLNACNAFYREIVPYLSEDERRALDTVRVVHIPARGGADAVVYHKLDAFEQELRFFRAKKKLGIVADDSPGSAALR